MKKAPTLADTIYRLSFRNETNDGWRANAPFRDLMNKASRFVLDERMSAFLGDLSNQAFYDKPRSTSVALADQLRISSRLPHATTWIEYNLRAYYRRLQEAYPGTLVDDTSIDDVPEKEGWLFTQHPGIETAFLAHIFVQSNKMEPPYFTLPFAVAWSAAEDILPWESLFANSGSEVVTGIGTYTSDRVALVQSPLLKAGAAWRSESIKTLAQEWGGSVRRMWALLATINDLPVTSRVVTTSKGFIARGQYRKYLEHRTITLNVPTKEYIKVARKAIAIARRKAHKVRGHWRKDWRHPGERTWIHEHQRGDASLGFVTHDYSVEHEKTS